MIINEEEECQNHHQSSSSMLVCDASESSDTDINDENHVAIWMANNVGSVVQPTTNDLLYTKKRQQKDSSSSSIDTALISQDTCDSSSTTKSFNVGDTIMVAARTWPGMNKLGGAGRITNVHHDNDGDVLYDVRYLLGGSEKRIEAEYIEASDLVNSSARKRRSRNFFHDEFADEYLPHRATTAVFPTPRRSPPQSLLSKSPKASANVVVTITHKSPRKKRPRKESTQSRKEAEFPERAADNAPSYDQRLRMLGVHPKQQRKQRVIHDDDSSSSSSSSEEEECSKDPSTRYFGGYFNNNSTEDDDDRNFIQPENDGVELPEDVKEQTGFVPASTSKGLLQQLQTQFSDFEKSFANISQNLHKLKQKRMNANAINHLIEKHCQCLVRSGIDVMDVVMGKLERKFDKAGKMMDPLISIKYEALKDAERELSRELRLIKENLVVVVPPNDSYSKEVGPKDVDSFSQEEDFISSDDDFVSSSSKSPRTTKSPRKKKQTIRASAVAAALPPKISSVVDLTSTSPLKKKARKTVQTKMTDVITRSKEKPRSLMNVTKNGFRALPDCIWDWKTMGKPRAQSTQKDAVRVPRSTESRLTKRVSASLREINPYEEPTMSLQAESESPVQIELSSEDDGDENLQEESTTDIYSVVEDNDDSTCCMTTSTTHVIGISVKRLKTEHSSFESQCEEMGLKLQGSSNVTYLFGTLFMTVQKLRLLEKRENCDVALLLQHEAACHEVLAQLLKIASTEEQHHTLVFYTELLALLRRLPTVSELLFSNPSYFDLNFDSEISVSPYIRTLNRIYFYTLQLSIVLLKDHRRTIHWSETTFNASNKEEVPAALSLEQLIRLVLLWLFDLMLYIPSTTTVNSICLSMWAEVIYVSEETRGGESAKTESTRTLYHVLSSIASKLQTLVKAYLSKTTVAGYFFGLKKGGGVTEVEAMLTSEIMWKLLIFTAPLSKENGEGHGWKLVKELLNSCTKLPFSNNCSSSSSNTRGALSYIHLILKRVRRLSSVWKPSEEIVAMLLRGLFRQDSNNLISDDEDDREVELPTILFDLATEKKILSQPKRNSFGSFIAQILIEQMKSCRYPVGFKRVERSILQELEFSPTSSSWNWETTSTKIIDSRQHLSLTVLASMGLCSSNAIIKQNQVSKYLSRNVEFYVVEIGRVVTTSPSVLPAGVSALYLFGLVLVRTQQSIVFLVEHLLSHITRLVKTNSSIVEKLWYCIYDLIKKSDTSLLEIAPTIISTEMELCFSKDASSSSSMLLLLLDIILFLLPKKSVLQQSIENDDNDMFDDPLISAYIANVDLDNTTTTTGENYTKVFATRGMRYLRVPLQQLLLLSSVSSTTLVIRRSVKILSALYVLAAEEPTVSLKYSSINFGEGSANIFNCAVGRARALPSRIISSMLQYGGDVAITGLINSERESLQNAHGFKLVRCWVEFSVSDFGLKEDGRECWESMTQSLERYYSSSSSPKWTHNSLQGCMTTKGNEGNSGFQRHYHHFKALCHHFATYYYNLKDSASKTLCRKLMVYNNIGVFCTLNASIHRSLRRVSESLLKITNVNWTLATSHTLTTLSLNFDLSNSTTSTNNNNAHFLSGIRKEFEFSIQFINYVYNCVGCVLSTLASQSSSETIFPRLVSEFFPSAMVAQYPTAARELSSKDIEGKPDRLQTHQRLMSSVYESSNVGITKSRPSDSFFEALRAFWEIQAYPSLINYLAETAVIYQTMLFETGWKTSTLRILVLNVLDPDGPLGSSCYVPLTKMDKVRKKNMLHSVVCGFCCTLNQCQLRYYTANTSAMDRERMEKISSLRAFLLTTGVAELLQQRLTSEMSHSIPILQFISGIVQHFTNRNTAMVVAEFHSIFKILSTFLSNNDDELVDTTGCSIIIIHLELCKIMIACIRREWHTQDTLCQSVCKMLQIRLENDILISRSSSTPPPPQLLVQEFREAQGTFVKLFSLANNRI